MLGDAGLPRLAPLVEKPANSVMMTFGADPIPA